MAAQDLVVLSGFHAGALIEARTDSFRIGTGEDSDVILIDVAGDGDLASLSWSDDHRAYRIQSLSEGVTINRRPVLQGASALLRRGQILGLSETRIGYGKNIPNARKIEAGYRRTRSLRIFGIVTAGLLIAGGLGNMAVGLIKETREGQRGGIRSTGVTASGQGLEKRAEAIEALRARVSEAGLAAAIAVDPEPGSDVIRASGQIQPAQSQGWQQIVRWFDGTHGAGTLLENDVTLASGAVTLPFDIRSITTSPQPRMTIHDGRGFQTGDTLPGGWRILEITSGEIRIARAGEILRLEF